MDKTSIAILGFGGRGRLYGKIALAESDTMVLRAVCEILPERLAQAHSVFGVEKEMCFSDENEFFARGKLADALIIATMDLDHYRQADRALSLGYDILLEKPVSPVRSEIVRLEKKARILDRRLSVCHVLRYTPFYTKLKELVSSGIIGEIIHIDQVENVGYFHQAHSFVRGNWRNRKQSSPMILQKCCHDLDILDWLVSKPCERVSSFGQLSYFRSENAPKGSARRCADCAQADCPYNALTIYSDRPDWLVAPFGFNPTKENIAAYLASPDNPYGRCVFRCDNDVVDHQIVNLEYAGGTTAHLTMTAFSKDVFRTTKVFGTKGEIEGKLEDAKLYLTLFGRPTIEISVEGAKDGVSVHSGGDRLLMVDFVNSLGGGETSAGLTSLEQSEASHFEAFAAEKSRIKGGVPVRLRNRGARK